MRKFGTLLTIKPKIRNLETSQNELITVPDMSWDQQCFLKLWDLRMLLRPRLCWVSIQDGHRSKYAPIFWSDIIWLTPELKQIFTHGLRPTSGKIQKSCLLSVGHVIVSEHLGITIDISNHLWPTFHKIY